MIMTAIDTNAVEAKIRQGEELNSLIQTKIELLKSLLKIEAQIAALTGNKASEETVSESISEPPYQPTPTTIKESGSRRGRKPKGEMSLANHILAMVQEHPEGLTREQITVMLLKAGYKSSSGNFSNVVCSQLSQLKAKARLKLNEHGLFVVVL